MTSPIPADGAVPGSRATSPSPTAQTTGAAPATTVAASAAANHHRPPSSACRTMPYASTRSRAVNGAGRARRPGWRGDGAGAERALGGVGCAAGACTGR
ncbi:hypothetical protein [Phytohabitans rumicis]|uniref:hypothetical protein n=1 Tax=Phytohabitans rumicis TaxID=1076125 RepID=UPI001567965D|nr:hypothetical protein [Phytohabitans rumicis]